MLSLFVLFACVFATSKIHALQLEQRLVLVSDSGATASPQIEWGLNSSHIDLQLSYPSLGWIAFGLSPNGGMNQTDVLFGYVDDQTQSCCSGMLSFAD